MPTRSVLLDVRLSIVAPRGPVGMDQRTIEHVMQRAITAIARPCYFHIAEPNLIQPRPDGWWCIGTVRLVDETKEWQVYWHPELGRGWLWGIARLQPRRVMPRRF